MIVERPVVVERRVVVDREIGADPISPSDEVLAVWLDDERYLLEDGAFFRVTSQGRVWVPTPVGALVAKLPIGAITIWHNEQEYFEFAGAYFRRGPDGFKVVQAPWLDERMAPVPDAGKRLGR